MPAEKRYFHLHLVSDATGETLLTVAQAVTAQYKQVGAIKHIHSLVRSPKLLENAIAAIDAEPGIVLFTLTNPELAVTLEQASKRIGVPCHSLLEPIFNLFQSYLGAPGERRAGAQHELNSEYFGRIDALNFTMLHDDGALPDDVEQADVILVGISRTSKTPTSIYLANRGIRTANVPLVPNIPPPRALLTARRPLIVALVATAERIFQVRQNRQLAAGAVDPSPFYADRAAIAEELAQTRKLCAEHGWPVIDVSRKSIEETAAAILALRDAHMMKFEAQEQGT
jgi:regulator of PEP synthase PpsR (kinase-PPPase family)